MNRKLDFDVCYRVYGWRRLVKATEVTAGLVESNGCLPPGGWLSHWRPLHRDQLRAKRSVASMGELYFLPFY